MLIYNLVVLNAEIQNRLTNEGEINPIGIWKGTYSYNIPEEFKDVKSTQVEFSIMIDSVLAKNRFFGSVEDNVKTGGTPGIGTIHGGFKDDEIFFEKNMPIHTTIEMDGSYTVNEKKKHPTIIYEGKVSRSKKFIAGTWRFKKKVLVWKGIIPLWIIPGQGEFKMEKIN